jgi:hypothetical protein
MNTLNFDALKTEKMATGHHCLNLSERVGWEAFPDFARKLLQVIGGQVMEKHDAPDIRLWEVNIGTCHLRLVFDDYPLMVSLESSDKEGDASIERIHRQLLQETQYKKGQSEKK